MITETAIKAAIRNAPTSRKRAIELKDGGERGAGRLSIQIRALKETVAAEWYAVYYRDGKRVMTKIGSYPTLSVTDARKRFREEYAPTISAGAEPASKVARRQHRVQGAVGTVEELFRAYVGSLANPRTANDAKRVLLGCENGSVRPAIASIGAKRLASEVSTADIVHHLAEVFDRGAPRMAAQIRSYLSAAFAFGMKSENDYTKQTATAGARWNIASNPVTAIPADRESVRVGNRFLWPREFRFLWTWLEEHDRRSSRTQPLRIGMATGQRCEEILHLNERQYDRPARMLFWNLTKTGTPHSIPLPPQAVDILDRLTPNRYGWFFPSRKDPSRPSSYCSLEYPIQLFLDETGIPHFTPRDLRRTWKTLAGRAGVDKEMRDRLQNHSAKSDVSSRHYDRYDYLAERRAAMERWAVYMQRILSGELDQDTGEGAQVVLLGKGAAA
jgi:integrase